MKLKRVVEGEEAKRIESRRKNKRFSVASVGTSAVKSDSTSQLEVLINTRLSKHLTPLTSDDRHKIYGPCR